MAKRKVKICMNQQCTGRVNKPDAAVCAGCGSSFRGISWEFLSEEQIEMRLHPEHEAEKMQEDDGDSNGGGEEKKEAPRMVIVCPSCGVRIPYRVGLEFCECGEYVQEEVPIEEASSNQSSVDPAVGEQDCGSPCVKGMVTLDGEYRLLFTNEWIKIGREATGRTYFEKAAKGKVSREHVIIQLIEGAWYLSYCKKEDRNYSGGVENPVYINGRRMDRSENYRLQVGDEIAFAELDKNDPMAAFFRVE